MRAGTWAPNPQLEQSERAADTSELCQPPVQPGCLRAGQKLWSPRDVAVEAKATPSHPCCLLPVQPAQLGHKCRQPQVGIIPARRMRMNLFTSLLPPLPCLSSRGYPRPLKKNQKKAPLPMANPSILQRSKVGCSLLGTFPFPERFCSLQEHPQCCWSELALRAGVWSGLAGVPCTTSLSLLSFAFPGWFSSQNLWVCPGRPCWQLLQTLGYHSFCFICSLSVLLPSLGRFVLTPTPPSHFSSPCCSHPPRLHPAQPNLTFFQLSPPLCCS